MLCPLRYLSGDCNCVWMQRSSTMYLPNQITLSFKTDGSTLHTATSLWFQYEEGLTIQKILLGKLQKMSHEEAHLGHP